MNETQLNSIKRLAKRFSSSLENITVLHSDPEKKKGPMGLPYGWILVDIYEPGINGKHRIQAGVSPEGNIHT